MLSYYFSNTQRNFQRHFPSSTISPVFGIHGIQRMLSAPNPLEFIIFRIKTAVFGCAPVSPNGRASHELSNKKNQCFQHVRPPTFRTKFHHSSMAMMTCQLSECERYHPVRRWWNHFIIYKNHPSTWCLRFPMGSKNIPSIPIQLANSRCDPPHVGTTEQENIIHDAIWTFDGKHNAKC